jgi:hypothetical protein
MTPHQADELLKEIVLFGTKSGPENYVGRALPLLQVGAVDQNDPR